MIKVNYVFIQSTPGHKCWYHKGRSLDSHRHHAYFQPPIVNTLSFKVALRLYSQQQQRPIKIIL